MIGIRLWIVGYYAYARKDCVVDINLKIAGDYAYV